MNKFSVDDDVRIAKGPEHVGLKGTVASIEGYQYTVRLESGTEFRCHGWQLEKISVIQDLLDFKKAADWRG